MSGLPIGASTTVTDIDQTRSLESIRSLGATAMNAANNKEKAKIEKSAREFESILVGQWLEGAEKSFATVPGDDPEKQDQDPGQDQLRAIAIHALADGLSNAGGIGIAAMISRNLEARTAEESKTAPTSPSK